MSRLSTYYKAPVILALALSLAACSKSPKTTAEKATQAEKTTQAEKPAQPAAPSQKAFASPEAAGTALFDAAQSGDEAALLAIFGPDGREILFTGDSNRDRQQLKDFAAAYQKMNRWGKIKAGGQTLYVGADNYPFPIPLGQKPSGEWYFDTAAGKDEILARRIGKNELTAIEACKSAASAQQAYFRDHHAYAQKFASDPGQHNGLYWPVAEGQPSSPLAQLGDFGKAVGSGGTEPFNGYIYRMFARPRGFVIVAFPAQYRDSGIMTFVVGEDGTVYQKDLGEKTADLAAALTGYNPAAGWTRATAETGTASRRK